MKIDWPLAIVLAILFVAMSYARWRWFRARLRRIPRQQTRPEPPVEPPAI